MNFNYEIASNKTANLSWEVLCGKSTMQGSKEKEGVFVVEKVCSLNINTALCQKQTLYKVYELTGKPTNN